MRIVVAVAHAKTAHAHVTIHGEDLSVLLICLSVLVLWRTGSGRAAQLES